MPGAPYSPRLRTGVILCGSGTAGAYHAGALRAIIEAGIKIDILAAHGAGVATALTTAVDGGPRLWEASGPWAGRALRGAYRWRLALRIAFWGIAAAALLALSPILVLALAAVAYAVSLLAALASLTGTAAAAVGVYQSTIAWLFDPPILPTVLPRLLLLGLLLVAGVLVGAALQAVRRDPSRRRVSGAFWWRLVGAPVEAAQPVEAFVDLLWSMVRGASNQPRPEAGELGRRYVDVLADNFGQPGFHEVVVAVHAIDARRDLVGALLAAPGRAAFEARRGETTGREAEIVDFTGPQRELLVGFLTGALRLPLVTEPALLDFPTDSYWRGERHRICDRPELVMRLVDELAGLGVEQVILVSPAPAPALPHALRARPIDLRARVGEVVRSMEAASLADAAAAATGRFSGVFIVRPDHNPIGAFDFDGAYDEASDRQRTLSELLHQGYTDAYRDFIEPVAAAGDPLDVV